MGYFEMECPNCANVDVDASAACMASAIDTGKDLVKPTYMALFVAPCPGCDTVLVQVLDDEALAEVEKFERSSGSSLPTVQPSWVARISELEGVPGGWSVLNRTPFVNLGEANNAAHTVHTEVAQILTEHNRNHH